MKNIDEIKQIIAAHKHELREKYNIDEIGVFGSYVRAEQTKASDVDILVTFSTPIGMFAFLELEEHLSNLFGVSVDLVSKTALKPRIGKHILEEVQMV